MPASAASAKLKKAAGPRDARSKTKRLRPLDPERISGILDGLAHAYPTAQCALVHHSAWELLVATILSAQCTDVRVNMVTPALFKKYPRVQDFASLTPKQIEPDIRSTGFYQNKSRSLVGAAKALVERFGGEVPDNLDELVTLPGVGRKTANVVLGVWFKKATGIVVDTHVQRISRRLQFTRHDDAIKIEQDLMKIIPASQWIDFSHRMIWHGRLRCIARMPKCAECSIETLCYSKDKTFSTL